MWRKFLTISFASFTFDAHFQNGPKVLTRAQGNKFCFQNLCRVTTIIFEVIFEMIRIYNHIRIDFG